MWAERATENECPPPVASVSNIPVAKGFHLPLVQPSLLAWETHGNTGLGYAKLPVPQSKAQAQHGVDFLIENVMKNPGEITLVAIGPLTNVAIAIRKEPRFAAALFELEGGATGTIASLLACPLVADLRLLGTKANLEARANFAELAVAGRVERFPEDDTLRQELAEIGRAHV